MSRYTTYGRQATQQVVVHSGGGISFMGLLFIVFLILKLIGVISWSWWWVTAPLWGPLAFGVSVVAVMFAIAGLIMVCAGLIALVKWPFTRK